MVTQRIRKDSVISLLLQPNCSLSDQGRGLLLMVTTCFFIVLSASFVAAGAWMVVPFLGVELMMMGALMLWVQRRSEAREILHIRPDLIRVSKRHGTDCRVWNFDPRLTSLMVCKDETDNLHHITLCGDSGLVELGDFLPESDLKNLLHLLEEFNLRPKKGQQWVYYSA